MTPRTTEWAEDQELIRNLRTELRGAEMKIAILEARVSTAFAYGQRGLPVDQVLEALRAPIAKPPKTSEGAPK